MYTSPQTIKVIKELLKGSQITQLELSRRTNVSIGQVNNVVKKLKNAFLANVDPKKGAKLVDESRLLAAIGVTAPLSSSAQNTLLMPFSQSQTINKIAEALPPQKYAFTLMSAIAKYSAYAQGETVSLYVDANAMEEALARLGKLASKRGIPVEIFEANEGILFDVKKDGNKRYVSNEQLLIDLFRTPQLVYVGAQLLREYKQAHST